MAGVSGMDPDLMGATGDRPGSHQRNKRAVIQCPHLDSLKLRDGRSAIGMHHALQPDRAWLDGAAPQERSFDTGKVGGPFAEHQRQIALPDLASHQLAAEIAGCLPGFGHEDEAGSLAVEPVDERDLAASGAFEGEQRQEMITQRIGMGRLARVGEHSGRFIDNQPLLRFVNNLEPTACRLAPMIELVQVSKSYATDGAGVHALESVDLRIEANEFAAITGPSGSGKSTLLHLIAGFDQPSTGTVEVGGVALHRANEATLTRFRRETLGIVFQFFNLLPTLTAKENVTLPLLLQGIAESEANERALDLLELVGLERRREHFPHQLSGGEMQRVAVARALVHRPKLLLADEPTGNLDSAAARIVLDLFRQIEAQSLASIIMVTHDEEVAATAPRRFQVRDGRLLE